MPALLAQDLDRQNICCKEAFHYFKDKKSVSLPCRRLVRLKVSDEKLLSIGLTIQAIYDDLDKVIEVPLELLDSINFKYECDDLCPFPECLDSLHAWELELILHYNDIIDATGWINAGLTLTRVSAWHNFEVDDLRRWNAKLKKIERENKLPIYCNFQPFIKYLPTKID